MKAFRALSTRTYLGRNSRKKEYYVFFRFNTKYAGCYAIVEETNIYKANMLAMELYGGEWNVANVYQAEFGANKAKALKYKKIECEKGSENVQKNE